MVQVEGCRRLWALVHNLPPDSATHNPDAWTLNNELTASFIEHFDYWSRNFAVMRGVEPSDLPPQLVIPRPGRDQPEVEAEEPSALIGFFQKIT